MRLNNSDGYILIMSLAVALFLTILLGAAFTRSTQQLKEADQRRAVQQAFYTAESGIDRALFELRRDPDWKPGSNGVPAIIDERLNAVPGDDSTTTGFLTLDLEDGPLIEKLGETRWVRAIGRDVDTNLERVVLAQVLIDDPSRFLLSTPGALRFKSGARVEADVLGQDLYFDVNDTLPADQRGITIDGDVLYIDELNPANPQSDPDITITGDVTLYPSVTFPGVDITRYDNLVSGLDAMSAYKENGDLTVNLSNLGSLNSNPSFAPRLIFATGDIHISGEFNSSVLIVAGGNLYIEGDVTADPAAAVVPQIGLFAKKDVVIPDGAVTAGGDLNLDAFVIADGSDGANGEFRAESTVGLGDFNFTGAISVRGGGGSETGIDLSVFAARNYTHKANIAVPFSPFIANIVTWQESTRSATFPPPSN